MVSLCALSKQEVSSDPDFNATIWDYYMENIDGNVGLQEVLYGISDKRGDENEEMMGEISGIVADTRLPFEFVKAIQMLQEITRYIFSRRIFCCKTCSKAQRATMIYLTF